MKKSLLKKLSMLLSTLIIFMSIGAAFTFKSTQVYAITNEHYVISGPTDGGSSGKTVMDTWKYFDNTFDKIVIGKSLDALIFSITKIPVWAKIGILSTSEYSIKNSIPSYLKVHSVLVRSQDTSGLYHYTTWIYWYNSNQYGSVGSLRDNTVWVWSSWDKYGY